MVGRVAVKPEPHVVPDPAETHGRQRPFHHLERPRLAGACVAAQQKQEPVRGREFRGRPETAVAAVEACGDVVIGAVQHAYARLLGGRVLERFAELRGEAFGRGGDLPGLLRPQRLDPFAELDQAAAAEAVAFGDIGRGEERFPVGGHENAERPAAAAGHHLAGGHVHGVDVGALLAVDLDADEGVVQVAGGFVVFEGFLLHHVAPVAGGVADGQEDGLVLRLGRGEGGLAPGVPLDRVVGVLQQIGAFFVDQAVGGHGVAPRGCRSPVCSVDPSVRSAGRPVVPVIQSTRQPVARLRVLNCRICAETTDLYHRHDQGCWQCTARTDRPTGQTGRRVDRPIDPPGAHRAGGWRSAGLRAARRR